MKKKFGLFVLALVLVLTALAGCVGQDNGSRYAYNYGPVNPAVSDPALLAEMQRSITLIVYQDGQPVFTQTNLGWVYSQEYVVVPIYLFYIPTMLGGRAPVWQFLNESVTMKTFISPDSEREDSWKKEELGEIIYNEELGIALIKRIDPVIETPQTQYALGEYEDLSLGHVLYQITQVNGRMQLPRSSVMGLYTDDKGRRLINAQGNLFFHDLGGLIFAVTNNGQFEPVGMVYVIEPLGSEKGTVIVHALDINQIVDYIKTVTETETK